MEFFLLGSTSVLFGAIVCRMQFDSALFDRFLRHRALQWLDMCAVFTDSGNLLLVLRATVVLLESSIEATKDLCTFATLAFREGSAEEKKEAKQTWQEVALQFFGDASSQSKAPKLYRTKVYEWLCSTNFQLLVATGHNWDRFIIPEDTTHPPGSWPSCTICVDQGSDGWSGSHYLRAANGVRRNILLLHDESHRLWNDTQQAVADSRLYPVIMSSLVCLNVDHGPWMSERWFATMLEAVAEIAEVSDSSDPLFQMLVQHMRNDMVSFGGRDEMELSDEYIWGSLREALQRKNDKVGMTRWFGYFESMQSFMAIRSRRLYVVLYIAMTMGMFTNTKLSELAKFHHAPPCAPGEDIPKSTTGQDRQEVQKLRASCKNTLAFSAHVLSNHSIWRVNAVLLAIVAPVKEHHRHQNKVNRSSAESLNHWISMASGCVYDEVNKIIQQLSSKDLFKYLQLRTWENHGMADLSSLEADDPIVAHESELVEQMGTFAVVPCSTES
eukprot:6492586-Amphidinium_carterae.1